MSFEKYLKGNISESLNSPPTFNQIKDMIKLHKELLRTVKSMWDMYERSDFNSIQPNSMSGKDGVYPMSLDDWYYAIQGGIRDWEEILKKFEG